MLNVLRIRHVFIPEQGSGIRQFCHPGSKHFFIPNPGSFMKSGIKTYFFCLPVLCFQEQNLSLSLKYTKSGNWIPYPGGKKAPDTGYGSATMIKTMNRVPITHGDCSFKGTVSRDFRPLVFFTNQPHLGP
jgi:hypothetical protein